jgi:breast cancer 2 susceptibility protein
MLKQITLQTAQYYSFHTASSMPTPTYSAPSTTLGPAEALKELLDRGCTLATKPWVDNHWSLILWKLAGMVNLDPSKEANMDEKRWCWAEVVRQLLYRSVLPPISDLPIHPTSAYINQLTSPTQLATDTNAS